MIESEIKLVVGALLHDIGKVIYHEMNDKYGHSKNGFDYLKNEIGLEDENVLNCVRYHHTECLDKAVLEKEAMAYLVYAANNIASCVERRTELMQDTSFKISSPLHSVFNILNKNQENLYYQPGLLNLHSGIHFPQKEKILFGKDFYKQVKENLSDCLREIEWTDAYLNFLLQVLEVNLGYVPAMTEQQGLADIPLYDHVKVTAAAASCIVSYLKEKQVTDYKEAVYQKEKEFFQEKAFLMFSMDVSGIQAFIYTITTKNALRTLRARSFYLEIMMEHLVDCLLQKLGLSRANLIYSGGGHCYMLLPNTEKCKRIVDDYLLEINHWFLETFQTELYVAGGYCPCSGNSLRNEPQGSYSDIFSAISEMISQKKFSRYTAEDILWLNHREISDYSRECRVCKQVGTTDEEGVCPVCRAIQGLSSKVLYSDFFMISSKKEENALELPGRYYVTAEEEETIRKKISYDPSFVRAYSKNKVFYNKGMSTTLWAGSYTVGQTFEELANAAEGVPRIGILRADVDNLGHAFVSGFENPANRDHYVTLSRTAILSRQLSLFFKLYINDILCEPEYSLLPKDKVKPRNAAIVYSGGDDLFLVGAWNEIIELSIDIRQKFKQYTQGTLTLSAGIGIYPSEYPISVIAQEVAEQEEKSKKLSQKNAVTLLEDGVTHKVYEDAQEKNISDGTYSWEEFQTGVVEEKLCMLDGFFQDMDEHGMAFLYHLLDLIRNRDKKINIARFVYLLSRMEPPESSEMQTEKQIKKRKLYQNFADKMYSWIQSEKDCRQLKTAINIYVYLQRQKED